MPRLFTAIEIPADVRNALSAMRGGLPGARWIDPENYHVTLRFIGDIDDAMAREVAYVLGKVKRGGFELRFESLHSFGGRKPRAIVAVLAPSQPLAELQAEHERLMRRIGLEPEARKYTPHVTLARLRDCSSQEVADYLSSRGWIGAAPFRPTQFVLFSSRDSVGGGPYLVEAAYPLSQPTL
jgi:2'-5' RNA ligase